MCWGQRWTEKERSSPWPARECWLITYRSAVSIELLANRNLGQTDILHDRPDNGQARRFGCKGVNLISALSHIAKEAFNRIRATNVAVHHWRKRIIRQKMFFIFTEAADGFGGALLVFGFKGRQIEHRLL